MVATDDDPDQCNALNETAEYKFPEFPHVSILVPLAHECEGMVNSQPHECSQDILVRELGMHDRQERPSRCHLSLQTLSNSAKRNRYR